MILPILCVFVAAISIDGLVAQFRLSKLFAYKLKALIQWLVTLELQQHRHWCELKPGRECDHQYGAWYCIGVFCGNKQRVDCAECRKQAQAEATVVE